MATELSVVRFELGISEDDLLPVGDIPLVVGEMLVFMMVVVVMLALVVCGR